MAKLLGDRCLAHQELSKPGTASLNTVNCQSPSSITILLMQNQHVMFELHCRLIVILPRYEGQRIGLFASFFFFSFSV